MKVYNCNGLPLDFSIPKIMAIVNLTPDSFYKRSRNFNIEDTMNTVEGAVKNGADIIDLGAVSTRPGADTLNFQEEYNRLIPVLQILRKQYPKIIISIDTFRSQIAKIALDEGANIINDISGGSIDENMFDVISNYKVPYILMHMRGNPSNMQSKTEYENIILEMLSYFLKKTLLLKSKGINNIIIDPGFGFAKSIKDNYHIIRLLNVFKIYNLPLLVGLSRKSMIYKLLNSTPEEALSATSALHLLALQNGANILRVHDVKKAVEIVKIFNILEEDT